MKAKLKSSGRANLSTKLYHRSLTGVHASDKHSDFLYTLRDKTFVLNLGSSQILVNKGNTQLMSRE